ncbi:fimbrial protein [Aeromonas rivuli]|uniref:fimbrial protein n=1 Tax=Aeromonas rivuli TaxID=648794 RepID=UPI001CCC4E85|nr:fimbrial protein [Aeromonas rivuli]UBO72388.1 type 1 fimbrial protein [Aeromonas rivuli]
MTSCNFKMMIQRGAVALLLYTGVPLFAQAAPLCTIDAATPVINYTAVLQGGNLTVGPDTPDGTIIFRQYFKPSYNVRYVCASSPTPYSLHEYDDYQSLPLPLSSWGGSPFGGQVYETGVPGIGVVAWYSGTAFPLSKNPADINALAVFTKAFIPEFDISFIKTGPISPGTIQGGQLPTLRADMVMDDGTHYPIIRAAMSGSINIVSQSCTTPDVSVDLGSHDIASNFSGQGSATPWVPFQLRMENCPTFYGTINDGQNNFYSNDGSSGVGAVSPNSITVSLTPNTAIIDDAQAIMGLADTGSQASGVGIQIAAYQESRPATFSKPTIFYQGSDGSPSRTVNYFARYIQTETTVTPGDANGTVSFLIEYK